MKMMKKTALAVTIILSLVFGKIRPAVGDETEILMAALEVTDIKVTAAVVSWVTDRKTSSNWVEVRTVETDSVILFQDKYMLADYVHYIEITQLTPDTEYLFRIGSDTETWDNQGAWYSLRTLEFQPQGNPNSIYGYVEDTYGEALGRVRMKIRAVQDGREPSAPRSLLTDSEGAWLTTIADILALDGSLYDAGPGTRLIIDYQVNYWSTFTDSTVVLGTESPQNLGLVSLSVFDPGKGIKGDLNDDEVINIFDLLDLLKILSGQTIILPGDERLSFAADLDSNGSVSIMDLLALLQILASAV
jgi:Purple acid Phosphatase, N-terminal domain/Dockerin type I domain